MKTAFPFLLSAALSATTESAPSLHEDAKAPIITECVNPGVFAITFDDGPSKNFPILMKKLDELKIKATFFVNAKGYADLSDPTNEDSMNLKAMFERGHQIGTHTYSHADLGKLDVKGMWQEMKKNDDMIEAIIGKRPTHLRPPYLSTSDQMQVAMGSWGYHIVSINLDTKDYEKKDDPNIIAWSLSNVKSHIEGSDPSKDSFISLDHDFTTKIDEWTETLVNLAKSKGYKFVTTSECIGKAAYRGDSAPSEVVPVTTTSIAIPAPSATSTLSPTSSSNTTDVSGDNTVDVSVLPSPSPVSTVVPSGASTFATGFMFAYMIVSFVCY